MPAARCLGAGKFLLVEHGNHTHFVYQLSVPKTIKPVQTEFNLKKEGDYLISIKNPRASTPQGSGLKEEQKTTYPSHLQEKFADYRFIPLSSFDFFNYLGMELLLINPGKSNLTDREEETRKCFSEGINENELLSGWAKITSPEAIVPVEEQGNNYNKLKIW